MVSSEHSNDSEEIVQSNNQGKIINNELDIPSYDRVSGTIPFEELYNSEPRKNDPHQDLISFPEVDTTVQYFTKIHKTPYAAKPDIVNFRSTLAKKIQLFTKKSLGVCRLFRSLCQSMF